ncbi:MAG: hypothetical protein ACRDLM_03190 [Gaiellaceae bacterium]
MNATELLDERARLFDKLAEISDGSTAAGFLLDEVGAEVGLDRRQAKRAFLRLRDDGLVELAGPGPRIAITHAGLRAAENGGLQGAVTPRRAEMNVIFAERIENSQIQQGVEGSVQVRKDLP